MLKKLETHTKDLLELADFLENLDPDRFSMSSWGSYDEPRCICGWYLHNKAYFDKADWPKAGEMLGLTRDQAHDLFHHVTTQAKAVKTLRRLAHTGELVL